MTFSEFKKITNAEIELYTMFGYHLTSSPSGYSDGEFKYSHEEVSGADVDFIEAKDIDCMAVYLKL